MTIDEITTALREWKGDNNDRHLLLLAVDDESITAVSRGKCLQLGYALALAMYEREETERIVQFAMELKEMDFLSNQDNDEE